MVQKSPYDDVPVATVPVHEMLLDAIKLHGKNKPGKPAIISAEDPSNFVTHAEIYDKSIKVSSYLASIGFGHHDMMGIVLPNCFEFLYFYLGAIRCGGAISGASQLFTNYELERQFLDAKCKLIVTDGDHLATVQKAVRNCPLIKKIIVVRRLSNQEGPNIVDYDDVIRSSYVTVKPFNGSMEDVAIVPYSSGTTGSPKGVMISHKNYATMMNIFVDHLNKMAVPRICPGGDWNWYNQSLFLVLPLYHDFGFSLLHICLLTGMTIILAKKFDPHVFLSSIERYRVEIFFCVPPTVLFLTKHPDLHKYNLSSLRIVMCGGAVLGKELAEEFSQIYKNAILCQGYGLTECSVLSHLPRFVREDGYESAGFPLATYEMKIVDPDTHAEMPNGSKGEIWLRAPTVMLGYLNRPEATAEMIDKDGWMKTGDIGYIDATGQTRILERIKEVIKVNGRQVSPSELEDVLMAQPEILDAAVIGIPDPKYGEIPKAFIIRSNEKLTKRDVEKLIEERFAVYKWLKGGVEFVAVIPKSPSGKILRRFLKQEARSRL